jgi:N-acetylglucosaminyl-diphospho-decaprenol L-rhamnosyltransferase
VSAPGHERVVAVTIAHGRHDHLALQMESLAACSRPPDEHVVVAMDDRALAGWPATVVSIAASAERLPLAAARNLGVRTALDLAADVVVCLDVDCLAGEDLMSGYVDAVASGPDVLWSGPVTYLPQPPPGGYDLSDLALLDQPHPARPAPARGRLEIDDRPDLFWSLSFACSASAWRRSGGFCEDYVGYGGEDTDFARVALGRDLHLGWVGSARAYHQWHAVSSPPVEHLDDIIRNGAIFYERWGSWPMQGWLEAFERSGLVRCEAGVWSRTDMNVRRFEGRTTARAAKPQG